MKKDKTYISKTVKVISTIILYYIIESKNIFPYIITLSLYNIYESCYSHISIKEKLKQISNDSQKKIFKYIILIISIISITFLLLNILINDLLGILLKIHDLLIIFIIMGISTITTPLVKLTCEYATVVKNNRKFSKLFNNFEIINNIFMLFIAIISFRIFHIKTVYAISLLYLSKILISILIITLIYYKSKHIKNIIKEHKNIINYNQEIKYILKNNCQNSIIQITKQSYTYISIIILYLVLNTRYNYQIEKLQNIIVFIYFYAYTIMDYLIYNIKLIINKITNNNINNQMYYSLKVMTPISITLIIISPLITKLLFNDINQSIYLSMVNILSLFILLYDITYKSIKNHKILYSSLIIGLITKIIIVIPLINSFYRMGYNLVYGDITSTIISMTISIIINYLYISRQNKNKDNKLEKILNLLYENIILSTILILLQFIVPISTDSYIKSMGLIIIYISVTIAFIKIKNTKRG